MRVSFQIAAICVGIAFNTSGFSAVKAAVIDVDQGSYMIAELGLQGTMSVDRAKWNKTAMIEAELILNRSTIPYSGAEKAILSSCQAPEANLQCVPGADDSVVEGEAAAVDFLADIISGSTPRDITDPSFMNKTTTQ